MLWLKILSKLIKAFRAGESPNQIAFGFAIGFFMGLMPFWTLQNFILLFILFIFNINLAAATVAYILASMFAYLLDPLFHNLGFFILTQIEFLQPFWEKLYNTVISPLTRFYNTVVMGSFVSGLILSVPVFFAMKSLVVVYREKLEAKINRFKIVQLISGSKIYQTYSKIRDFGGN